jgi:peptidoglycan lytic transglycosylase D
MRFSMDRFLILFLALLISSCAPVHQNISPHHQSTTPASQELSKTETVNTSPTSGYSREINTAPVLTEQPISQSLYSISQTNSKPSNSELVQDAQLLSGIPLEGTVSDKTIQPVLDEALEYCQTSQDFWQKGELENALEALDQAYALILQVDTNNIPKLIQQKEDLRFTISKRILEIYASRNIVVNGNHHAIPMVMNEHIEKELKLFQGREKAFFINSYKRSGIYRPHIVAELKKNGLPVELSWLPLIESGFKVRALSKARALGLWQFIPSTGYKFGLKRNT